MSDIISWQPIMAMAISFFAVPLIVVSRKHPNLRETWTLIAALAKWGIVLSMLPAVLAGQAYSISLFSIVPGIPFAFRVDTLGIYFALIASTLWIVTSIYSIGYVRGVGEQKQTRYFASFALCLSATIGIAFAANLVTFFICYEILSIATYPLVIHKETPEAIRSGRKYLAFALTAGLCLLTAIIWLYQQSPALDFQAGGFLETTNFSARSLIWIFVLFLVGCGVKAGIMPLQSWLPAAMVAPTPVSALLHAVAVVKAGVFGLLRITGYVFGPETLRAIGGDKLLAVLATITLLVGSLLALRQTNLKRRLAYSTIAHLSYILLGAALLGVLSWRGSLLHLANHATLKITLFFCAGALYVKTRRENISDLDGIGRQMPWTMGAFTLAALGLVGFPPLNGFVSKWYLTLGMLDGMHYFYFGALLVASLLCAGYLLPVAYRAFFVPAASPKKIDEASPWLVIPLITTVVLSFLLGIFPNLFFRFFELAGQIATAVIGGTQ